MNRQPIAYVLPAVGAVITIATPWYQQTTEKERLRTWFFDNDTISSLVSIVLFLALCIYVWVDSTRKSAATEA